MCWYSGKNEHAIDRPFFTFLVLSAALALSSCALERNVRVVSHPPDAVVRIDGEKQDALTPLNIQLVWEGGEYDRGHEIVVEKEDYEPFQIVLTEQMAEVVEEDTWQIEADLKTLTETVSVRFSSDPRGVGVSIAGAPAVKLPTTIPVTFERMTSHSPWEKIQAVFSADRHETKTVTLDYESLVDDPTVYCGLELLRASVPVEFRTEPEAATIRIDDRKDYETPTKVYLAFERPSSQAEWSTVQVVAFKKNYTRVQRVLGYEEVRSNSRVYIDLDEVRREVPVNIDSNVKGALIKINNMEIGETPLRYIFKFARETGADEWSTHLLKISKERYRTAERREDFVPGETSPFTKIVTIDEAGKGEIVADLEEVRFLRTKLRRWDWYSIDGEIEEEIVLSEIGKKEQSAVSTFVEKNPNQPLMETRICVIGDGEKVIYSWPYRFPEGDEVYANLFINEKVGKTRFTDSPHREFDPMISPDMKWVYFCSNRLGQGRINIWSKSLTSKPPGLFKITDSRSSQVDSYPALSPDNKKMAFTRLLKGAKEPTIWVRFLDESKEMDLIAGTCPAWAQDSEKLAYVAPDPGNGKDKIWVFSISGGHPKQITQGNHRDRFPTWTPDGRFIVYASDQNINAEGQHHFDIWIIEMATGQTRALTSNGSYDSRPAVSADGKKVFFISNRGAEFEGEESLQICSIDLEQIPE